MKQKIKIQSLNMKLEEFVPAIYHQTGLQLKYNMRANSELGSDELKQKIADAIKEFEFDINEIFEDENNFEESFFTKKSHWDKRNLDSAVGWLVFFRKHSIKINYEQKQKDMERLRNVSPPIHDWLISYI